MTSQIKTIRAAMAATIAQANALEGLARVWCKPEDYVGIVEDADVRDAVAVDRALRRLTDKAKLQFEQIQKLSAQAQRADEALAAAEARVAGAEARVAELENEPKGLTDFWTIENVRALVDAYNAHTGDSYAAGFAQELFRAGREVFHSKPVPWELTKVIEAAEKVGWKIKEPLWEFVEQLGLALETEKAAVSDRDKLLAEAETRVKELEKQAKGELTAAEAVAASPRLQAMLREAMRDHERVDDFMHRRSGVPPQILAHMINIRSVLVCLLKGTLAAGAGVSAADAPSATVKGDPHNSHKHPNVDQALRAIYASLRLFFSEVATRSYTSDLADRALAELNREEPPHV